MRRLCQCRPPAWSTIIALPALPRAKERLTGRGWRGSAREMPGFQFDRSLQQILDVFGSAIMQPPRFADFDPVLLPRLQFAFTVTFHIIFQSFTIGLSAFIATPLVHWIVTGGEHLHRLARFWTKIFAISFAMGVVSEIVLSYQFGTNWSRFSLVVGNVIAPLIGYEVLTAFFLEATFLGVMLFGWKRVPPWLHVFAAVAVAVGTAMSAFWILSANSWMQTPTGHEVRDGIAYPVDWFGVVFNPSFLYRLPHMLTAAYLTTSLVVLAVGARYLLAARHIDEGRTMMRMAIGMLAVLAPCSSSSAISTVSIRWS